MERIEEEQEKEEIYKELYMYGNTEKNIDYMNIVRLYRGYLSLFFCEESSFYRDLEFLSYVVDGFSYFHDMILGEVELDPDVVMNYLIEHDAELRKKDRDTMDSAEEGYFTYTEADTIFVYSVMTSMFLEETSLLSDYSDMVVKMFDSSYLILNELSEENDKGSDSHGMEYWKSKN